MPLYQLTISDIRRSCGTTFYQRGLSYYRSGRVVDFDLVEGDRLVYASVSGSGRRVYEQTIQLSLNRRGGVEIDGTCSCPMYHNCKHVAAALLDVLEYLEFEKKCDLAKSNETVTDLEKWQQQTLEALQREQQNAHSPASPQALLYVLQEKQYSPTGLVCHAVRTRRLKRGGWGKTSAYNLRNIKDNWYSTPNWIHSVDSDIATLLLFHENSYGSEFEVRGEAGLLALKKMIASGRCYWHDTATLLSLGPDRLGEWNWQSRDDGSTQLIFSLAGCSGQFRILETDPPYYFDLSRHQCGLIDQPFSSVKFKTLLQLPPVEEKHLPNISLFLRQNYQQEQLPLPVELAVSAAENSPLPKLRLLRSQTVDGGLAHIARVTFYYRPIECRPRLLQENSAITFYVEQEGVQWLVTPDVAAEASYLQQLESMGLKSAQLGGVISEELDLLFPGDTVAYSAACWKEFLEKIPILEADGWVIEMEESFSLEFVTPDSLTFQLGDDDFGDWFEMGLEIEYNQHRFPLLPLLTEWLEQGESGESGKQLLMQMPDGKWLCCPQPLLSQVCETLIELFDAPQFNSAGQFKLHRSQLYQLSHLEEELVEQGETLVWQGGEELRQLMEKLKTFGGLEPVQPPATLNATLRDYQRQGLSWLQFLREYRFNGILADDMGLGKTVQTLAHLLLEKEAGRLCFPALVVAPTSVLSVWKNEAEKFASPLQVLVLHGPQRQEHFSHLDEYDLIITSYALLNRDLDILRQQTFSGLILDEAQAIKNPRSKVAQAAGQIAAEFRLCLTGTPVENHLGELWSLFHFLMPGFLGTEKQFRQLFRKPIEQQGDITCQQTLQRRVLPFVLRRDKQQVASELPKKTTMIRSVDMGSDQIRLYESVRSAMSKRVRDLLAKKGLRKSHIEILDALLKLRQVCCDPRLVKLDSARKVKKSAKLELLLEMVEQLLEEGRKILIFSQFTSMLALIETELKSRAIQYSKLTGRTMKRDLAVSRFQNGEVPVFLISLKAGGVGLNLTAADTVIHYDPWWNPAVENQATDRAYRIGQDKPVFVYKLIVNQTVEEKILQLQDKKQKLADGVYARQASEKRSLLTGDDLISLFEK